MLLGTNVEAAKSSLLRRRFTRREYRHQRVRPPAYRSVRWFEDKRVLNLSEPVLSFRQILSGLAAEPDDKVARDRGTGIVS